MMRFGDYYKDSHIFAGLGVSLFLNIAIWSLLAWRIFPLQEQVVIHYNVYFGIDQFGPAWHASILPGLGLLIIIINFFIGWVLWKKINSLGHIINYFSLSLQLILLLAVIFTILANI